MGTYTMAAIGTLPTSKLSDGTRSGYFAVTMSGDYATGGDTGDWSAFFDTAVVGLVQLGVQAANADGAWRLQPIVGTFASPTSPAAVLIQAWNGTTEAAAMDDLNDVVFVVKAYGY